MDFEFAAEARYPGSARESATAVGGIVVARLKHITPVVGLVDRDRYGDPGSGRHRPAPWVPWLATNSARVDAAAKPRRRQRSPPPSRATPRGTVGADAVNKTGAAGTRRQMTQRWKLACTAASNARVPQQRGVFTASDDHPVAAAGYGPGPGPLNKGRMHLQRKVSHISVHARHSCVGTRCCITDHTVHSGPGDRHGARRRLRLGRRLSTCNVTLISATPPTPAVASGSN